MTDDPINWYLVGALYVIAAAVMVWMVRRRTRTTGRVNPTLKPPQPFPRPPRKDSK